MLKKDIADEASNKTFFCTAMTKTRQVGAGKTYYASE